METLRTVPVHEGSKFTWCANSGVAELSDFRPMLDGRVWADANDTGFIVRSERTQREVLFVLNNVERDTEGEIIALHYVNYGRFGLGSGTYKITVVND